MEAPLPALPYSPALLAESRRIVTRFDTVIAQEGPHEARELRGEAWEILLADHAARLAARRLPLLRPSTGDAA